MNGRTVERPILRDVVSPTTRARPGPLVLEATGSGTLHRTLSLDTRLSSVRASADPSGRWAAGRGRPPPSAIPPPRRRVDAAGLRRLVSAAADDDP